MSNSHLSSSQRLLLALKKARAQLKAIKQRESEPIAIIGMGCRFPEANSPAEFWELLREERDPVREIPADRFPIDTYYDPEPNMPGKMYIRQGAFLDQVDQFDPHFFEISPREAVSLDPQQRLLLEVSWEALEYAGLAATALPKRTGIFVGIGQNDYAQLQLNAREPKRISAYDLTGNLSCFVSGRLSYLLGLQGPNMVVDTACSSSLVAIHLACQSLRTAECELAIAGGVHLILSPEITLALSRIQALAPDGRCKTFSAQADGYGRGEGCGMIVLKRLSDAQKDGDNILALIRGSAVNHDGPSSGLTVPNKLAQEALLRQALKNAQVSPQDVSYVEAHGTGTELGDPIEVRALAAVMGERVDPLLIGSVKTNIAHLEAAAGVAGLIKVVLAFQHGEIPSNLHFNEPNPHIAWDDFPLMVPTERTPWPKATPIAGVSSFGMSGTNAHVFLQAPASEQALVQGASKVQEAHNVRPLHLLCLSAKTEDALEEVILRYNKYLTDHPEVDLADVCFTANAGRSHFSHRLSVLAPTSKEMSEKLAAVLVGENRGQIRGQIRRQIKGRSNKVAFLFTGQGSQYIGMGRELYETQPTFRHTLTRCDEIWRAGGYTSSTFLEQSLLDVLYPANGTLRQGTASLLDETAYTQPALFALEYALAQLLLSWGIKPNVVMGHSVGELVAACVAGVFSLEDGLKLVSERGRLMQSTKKGQMVAVFADSEIVRVVIHEYPAVSIAAINAPQLTVISGPPRAVESAVHSLDAYGIKTKKLTVSHGFHSSLMEPILDRFGKVAADVSFHSPQIPLIGNTTGELVTNDVASPDYWVRHIRRPVRFADGMDTLLKMEIDTFVEIGPKPTLLGMGRRCLPDNYGRWLPTLRPSRGPDVEGTNRANNQKHSDWQPLLSSVGQLYVRGVEIDWEGFDRDYARRKVLLPTYAFQRERYWVEPIKNKITGKSSTSQEHPLLQERLYSAALKKGEVQFEAQLSATSPSYLADHRVFGEAILPASAYLEMALAAGSQLLPGVSITVSEVVISQALLLNEPKTVQLILRPSADVLTPDEDATASEGGYSWQIFSLVRTPVISSPLGTNEEASASAHTWTCHATGKIAPTQSPRAQAVELAALQARLQEEGDMSATLSDSTSFYQQVAEQSIVYGESFQGVRRLWRSEGEALGEVQLVDGLFDKPYQWHPALLDASLQVLIAALPVLEATYVPVRCQRFTFWKRPSRDIFSHVQVRFEQGQETVSADLRLMAPDGQVIASIIGFQLKKVRHHVGAVRELPRAWHDWLYKVAWQPQAVYGLATQTLLSPQVIGRQLASYLSNSRSKEFASYQEELFQLDRWSVTLIVQAFQQLGFSFEAEQRFTTTQLATRLAVVPSLRRLLARLLAILAQERWLQWQDPYWMVMQRPSGEGQEEPTCQQAKAERTLLARCGSKLMAVLRGALDPVQLLFPNGDLSTTMAIYEHSPTAQQMNTLMQQALLSALDQLPADRGVRVLEIGAGTGGTSAYLLPHLPPERTEYVFTDISPLFINRAQEKFKAYPFVHYQVLNIEQAPSEQGFFSHRYDLVVAANVLHATQDLRKTLQHVYQLLAPGGMLLLLEETERKHWIDLTFGLTEGWWRFTDFDLRPDYPLLPADKWTKLLEQVGFSFVSTTSPAVSSQAVIVAQRDNKTPSRNWLILADHGGVGEQLAEMLAQIGENPILAFCGERYEQIGERAYQLNLTSTDDYQRLLNLFPTLYGVIHLWSLDAPAAQNSQDLQQANQLGCRSTLYLVQKLIEISPAPRLWLVTRGAQAVGDAPKGELTGVTQAALWGMGKVIALEHPELNCVRVDLDPGATENNDIKDAQILWEEIQSETEEGQVAWRERTRYVARLTRAKQPLEAAPEAADALLSEPERRAVPARLLEPERLSYQLAIRSRGTLEHLVRKPIRRREPRVGEVEIRVRATGLNFLDVLDVLGLLPFERQNELGGECTGQIVAIGDGVEGFEVGDAVMALALGSFSQYITLNADLVIPIPESLSFEEACTIPVNFSTAYHALHQVAHISAGERVLIHAATGGTGMAAVQLAQRAGAEVFATASPSKWPVLAKMGVKHIYNSRNLEFASQILRDTKGEGVDLVLNSLTGKGFIAKSVSVLSEKGRFIELAKRDIWGSNQVSELRSDVSYFLIDLRQKMLNEPAWVQMTLRHIIKLFEQQSLKPLPQKIFPISDVVNGFRYMQQAKHTGKIVITYPADKEQEWLRQPSFTLRGDRSYLITGGLGGLGLQVARRMIERGVQHLVLVSRREPSPAVRNQLKQLEEKSGAQIVVAQADVSQQESLAQVIAEIEPPLSGVIHSAGVLADGILQQQSWSDFAQVLAPKVQGAWHLQQLTNDLDFFVLFSSTASLLGSAGQANHAAANAFLDSLAFYRRSLGLPALSINWGGWSQVGAAALLRTRLQTKGMGMIAPQQGLAVLEQLFAAPPVQVGVVPINWSTFKDKRPFFSDLQSVRVSARQGILQKLRTISADKRRPLLEAHVCEQVAQVLGHKEAAISLSEGLFEMGMDSLTSVELRNHLQSSLECSLPSTFAFDYPTVGALVDYLAQEIRAHLKTEIGSTEADITQQEASHQQDKELISVSQESPLDDMAQRLAKKLGIKVGADTLISHPKARG